MRHGDVRHGDGPIGTRHGDGPTTNTTGTADCGKIKADGKTSQDKE